MELRTVGFDHPDAQRLTEQVQQEYVVRYGGIDRSPMNPREFDPTRNGNRHFTLVAGVHSCLGGHLARRELRLLLEKWFEKIPNTFRIKPGNDSTVFPGLLSIRNLHLVWDVK